MDGCITFARYVHHHTFCHACGNLDLHHLIAFHDTGAVTLMTLVLDDLTFALTGRTNALGLHHAEQTLGGACHHTTTMTGGAGFCTASIFSTRTMTMRTGDVFPYLELLGDTRCHLLQGETNLQTKIGATVLCRLTTAAAEPAEARETATSAKHIAKHGEDVIHGESTAGESAEAAHVRTVEAELVVLLTFLRIVEHIVGFCSLLELLFRLLTAWIPVWMVFDGYLAIGFLDVFLTGVLVNAQHFVVVSLCH